MEIKFYGGDAATGDVFVVETIAEAGYMLESHKHTHAHQSVLVSGTAIVTIDGVSEEMVGYRMVTVPADTIHSVEAITDIVWLCLWAGDLAPRKLAEQSLKLVKL
jgi:quercetin dioxygenase-like cupin family protein